MRASFTLEKPNATYFPGDTVVGSFSFENLDVDQKIVKVKISLQGKSSVEFMRDTNDCKTISIFISEKNLYLEDQKSYRGALIKPEDEYYSHFFFKIPHNWPQSFRGIYGKIRYTLKGEVIITKNYSKSKEFEIIIQPKLPLTIIHQRCELNFVNTIVPIAFCDCNKDVCYDDEKIHFQIKTTKKIYTPNEDVEFCVEIINKSMKRITKLRYYFLREEKYEGNMVMSDDASISDGYDTTSLNNTQIYEMRKKVFVVNVNIKQEEKKILTASLNVGKSTSGVDFGGNINVRHFIVVEAIPENTHYESSASARLRLYIDSVDFEKGTNFSKL